MIESQGIKREDGGDPHRGELRGSWGTAADYPRYRLLANATQFPRVTKYLYLYFGSSVLGERTTSH